MGILSTSQSGTIAEYYLTSAIMSASAGRLSPFSPASDDHGVDLLVVDKAMAGVVGIQVKSWRADKGSDRKTVQFDVRRATFLASPKVLLAAIILDPGDLNLELGWLLPMHVIPTVAVESSTKFALAPSRSPNSNDRYAPYRHASIQSLVAAIETYVRSSGG